MKINPIAIFTALAVGAAGTATYVSMNPAAAPVPVAEVAAPAPAQEAAPKPEEKVAAATTPIVQKAEPVAPAPLAPSFDTVRVETGGETVIAGRAEPGVEVSAMLNGAVIATATASPDGSFVMIPAKPLPAGAGTLSLETKKDGVVLASTATVAVAVKPHGQGESTVAVLAPDQPTKILQAPASPSNAVVMDAVDYDASGNIVFAGRSLPGTAVRLYVDNALAGEVKADDGGKWNFTGTAAVAAGTHTLRVDAIAVDGSVSSRVELPFLREQAAAVTAAQPAAEPPKAEASVPVAPAAAPAAQAVAEAKPEVAQAPIAKQPTKIVIQPGNNLWTISRELYGYGKNYTVIYEANKDQIRNPRLIYPGQIITAPMANSSAQ
jgi:nucleoid-associated protein YgaU